MSVQWRPIVSVQHEVCYCRRTRARRRLGDVVRQPYDMTRTTDLVVKKPSKRFPVVTMAQSWKATILRRAATPTNSIHIYGGTNAANTTPFLQIK